MDEENQVKERMADIQKDIARLKDTLKLSVDTDGKLKIRTAISDKRDAYFQ